MCGICGMVVTRASGRAVEPGLVERMRDTMVHRGPDGAGLHVGPGVGLGHRRLSIVDVAHGAQPMHGGEGHLHIVYNGEVFNHPVLSAELQQQGVRYATHCDTETVLHMYEREGPASVRKLRGMFAIAIWDDRTHTLFLARDRFGVKPVYYHLAGDGTLAFGSEIKAVLASGLVRPALNASQLPDYLANHAPSGDETLFEGIRRLPPGHTLTWRDGQVTIERYWDLHYAKSGPVRSEAEVVAEFTERFTEAVRIRLMADVPLGMFLSGGIDSAAITATMAPMVDGPIKTFSVAFAEREANELHYARLVSQAYRTDHHEVVVTPRDFLDAVPRLVWHEDEPMAHPSSVALHFVSRLAAERVKVVLTGEGSDEMLAGYNRYRLTRLQMEAGARYEALVPGPLRAGIAGALRTVFGTSRTGARLARTFLMQRADLETLYFDAFAVFGKNRQGGILSPAMRERVAGINPYAAYHRALGATDARDLVERLLYADVKTYLHELLMKQDQMSMSASIESRVPFLDHPLAEWVAALPLDMKLRGYTTKHVLRAAMQGKLPAEILSRKKMGFPVPFGGWMRGAHAAVLRDFVLGPRARARDVFDMAAIERIVAEHQAGANHDERVWALVNFEAWQRIFLDGEDPSAVRLP
jgi:asparagine synthase (glutamine-hydrolysing)